jgi:hypothetical protein
MQPQTGCYWWGPANDGWRLFAFYEHDHPGAIHQEIWERWAGIILGVGDRRLPWEVRAAYSGLPRGRVSRELDRQGDATGRWLILHGNDTPVRSGLRLVRSRFNLPAELTEAVFDAHHEQMLKYDVRVLERYLQRDLKLSHKAVR